MSYWQTTEEVDGKWKIPDEPGVYVIYLEDGRLYIGSSVRMNHNRFRQHTHWMKREGATKVKWKVSRRLGDWAMIEIRLTYKLKSKLLNIRFTDKGSPRKTHESVNNYVTRYQRAMDESTPIADELIALLEKEK